MARFVVGDIQACYSGLRQLLDLCHFDPAHDKLYAVGDLIGRGPEPLDTLDFLMDLGERFECVLGNHDLHFLAVYAGVVGNKDSTGFAPVLESTKVSEYAQWLRQQPLALQPEANTLMTHAGLYPGWTLDQAQQYANEVSQRLQSDQWQHVLSSMYGNEPDHWRHELTSPERERFIINALTRMRFVTSDQRLEFANKSSLNDAPSHLIPWFRHPNLLLQKHQRVIFGHWAALGGKTDNPNIIGLDTGYVWQGAMTALELGSKKCLQIAYSKV